MSAHSQTLLAVSLIAAGLRGENLNVSKIVTGQLQSMNFTTAAGKPFLFNTATLTYNTKAIGKISSQASTYFLTPWWYQFWQPGPQFPMLQRSEATPAPAPHLVYASPYYKLALVDMTSHPRQVESRIFKSGSSNASSTYAVQVQHVAATAGDYFVLLQVPTLTTAFNPAYSLCCPGDSNGGTYNYKSPTTLKMRDAVDMYVNGLPVWSSEKLYTYPETLANYPWDELDTFWGRTGASGSDTLYLGRFQAGDTFLVSFVARTNVDSNAPDCGAAHYGPYTADTEHCTDATARVQMAGLDGSLVSFSIYAKQP